MSRGEYRWREAKKPKKGAKKLTIIPVLQPQTTVEVIKKGKKEQQEE